MSVELSHSFQDSCMYCHPDYQPNSHYLNYSYCNLVTDIQTQPEHKTSIHCYYCPLLACIAPQPFVQNISCYDSKLLESIGNAPNVTQLGCYGCPLLLNLPFDDRLTDFNCNECPLLHLNLRLFIKCNGMIGLDSGFPYGNSRFRNGISFRFYAAFVIAKRYIIVYAEKLYVPLFVSRTVPSAAVKCIKEGCQYCDPGYDPTNNWFWCRECRFVKTIVSLPQHIMTIDCTWCPLLTLIEPQPYLRALHAGSSPMLTIISESPNVVYLGCGWCPLLLNIPFDYHLTSFYCDGCPLLHLKLKLFFKCEGAIGFDFEDNVNIIFEEPRPRNGASTRFQSAFLRAKAAYAYLFDARIATIVAHNHELYKPGGSEYLKLVEKYRRDIFAITN